MPWLAIATRPDMRDLKYEGSASDLEAFLAFGRVCQEDWTYDGGRPDALLKHAALGGYIHSSFWLAKISKYSVYSKLGWQPWKVEKAASRVRPFEKYGPLATDQQRRFYESAAAFLRVCADLGLGIRFSR